MSAKPELMNDKRKWKFHVSLREKKREGVRVQLKFGKHVLAEGTGERVADFSAIAKKWNSEGRAMTTKAEFAKLVADFSAEMPMHQDDLNFGGPTLPFKQETKPTETTP